MGKSLGNFITLEQFFAGNHDKLEKAYNPMTVRFFILQAHYRSTLDFGNEALQAAEKGLTRLSEAMSNLDNIPVSKLLDHKSFSFLNPIVEHFPVGGNFLFHLLSFSRSV